MIENPAIQASNQYEIFEELIDYKHCNKIITIVILPKRDVGFGGFLTGVESVEPPDFKLC
jgi:hypothetical protein